MSPIEQIRYDIQARLEAHDGTVDMSDYYSAQLAALDDIERRLETAERVAGRQVAEASKWFKRCESLESDAAALRKALEPFAECEGYVSSRQDWPDERPLWTRGRDGEPLYTITAGDLRRAARALKGQP